MKGWLTPLLSLTLAWAHPVPTGAQAATVQLATLDWPPFSGSMAEGGSAGSIIAQALGSRNLSLQSQTMPWKRAVSQAMAGDGVVGFYPASPVECAGAGGQLSTFPIGHYQFALAQAETAPVRWEQPDDLLRLRIGIVDGYDNGPLIDGLRQQGRLVTDTAQTDMLNLRKLQAGRIDAAVVEISQFAVLAPMLNRTMAAGMARISLNPRPLDPPAQIHVCFNHSPAGQAARQALDEGLAGIDVLALQADYLARHAPELNPTN
ncbi:hypothetical protein GE253_10500 [Niveispirillum sp. SYP-B3756]|uniref:substrate-binding periplasmic protein n=1 Tax=Niveispirillum sp. SYP-B3756 TaxID=2662178 RepID=UPI001291472F|nr:hypothetical protein [Niveispirillum sp. SYP-B3756]MQP65770.1 hypothetical protein [Niveispirillum sp. SYP-B3756]